MTRPATSTIRDFPRVIHCAATCCIGWPRTSASDAGHAPVQTRGPYLSAAPDERVNHHNATIPLTPATTEAAKIPVLAAAKAGVEPNASPAMKSDIVNPIPVSTDPAANTDHLKLDGRV